jgi:hypothetical protein
VKCPHCGARTRLFKSQGDVVKMRAAVLVFTDGGTKCVVPCPKCKEEIQVPVELRKAEVPETPKLVLGNHRLTPSPGDP